MFENHNKIENSEKNNLEKREEIKNIQELVEFFTTQIKENLALFKERISLFQKDKNISFEDLKEKILENNNFIQKIKIDSFLNQDQNKEKEESLKTLFSILKHDIGNKFSVLVSAIRLWEKIEESQRPEIILEMERKIIQIEELISAVEQTIQAIESKGIILNNIQEVAAKAKDAYNSLDVKINSDLKKGLVITDVPLVSVFDNIFANALRHGQATEIEINIEKEDNQTIIIEIENNGKKLKQGLEKKIFTKGFKDRETGGTGMGLFLIKNIVEKNQGEIKAINTAKGVKFILKFPLFKKI